MTIIITTYNRYLYLERLLAYYLGVGLSCPIIILDSSSEPVVNEDLKKLLSLKSVVVKKYAPNIFIAVKIADGLQYVKTPYAVLCAEDDFVIPFGVARCIDFLEKHEDYNCAHGRYFAHLLNHKKQIRTGLLYTKATSIADDNAYNRIKEFFPDKYEGYPFYAVHRTEIIKKVWQETQKYVFDWGWPELFSSCASLILGKMKKLSVIYASREVNLFTWLDYDVYQRIYSENKNKMAIDGLSRLLQKTSYERTLQEAAYLISQQTRTYMEMQEKVFNEQKEKKINNKLFFINALFKLHCRVQKFLWIYSLSGMFITKRELNRVYKYILIKKIDSKLLEESRKTY